MVTLCGWEGDRRSGVTLVMRHGLNGLSSYGLNDHRQGDEHLAQPPLCGVCHLTRLGGCFAAGLVELVMESETLRKIQVKGHGLAGSFKDRSIVEWLQVHNPTELDFRKVSRQISRNLSYKITRRKFAATPFYSVWNPKISENILVYQHPPGIVTISVVN